MNCSYLAGCTVRLPITGRFVDEGGQELILFFVFQIGFFVSNPFVRFFKNFFFQNFFKGSFPFGEFHLLTVVEALHVAKEIYKFFGNVLGLVEIFCLQVLLFSKCCI